MTPMCPRKGFAVVKRVSTESDYITGQTKSPV
jgi:hypothetical protein